MLRSCMTLGKKKGEAARCLTCAQVRVPGAGGAQPPEAGVRDAAQRIRADARRRVRQPAATGDSDIHLKPGDVPHIVSAKN